MNKSVKIIRRIAPPLAAWVFTAALITPAQGQAGKMPPAAPIHPVTEELFGTTLSDPYRWMEDQKSAETQKWMRAQAGFADAYLKRLPQRAELLKRLTEVTSASVSVSEIRQRGNRFFYLRRAPDESDDRLYVRDGLTGVERLLVDPILQLFKVGTRTSAQLPISRPC